MPDIDINLHEMTVAETLTVLQSHGMNIGRARLCAGLEQKVYPFGDAIRFGTEMRYYIYPALLEKWISEKGKAEEIPEWVKEFDRENVKKGSKK